MKKQKIISLFKYLPLLFFFVISSCGKDDEASELLETITIQAANFSVIIEDNPENEQVLGIMEGSTNEGTVSFSISSQTPTGAFVIDSSTGELIVANAELFDNEINPIISGIVKVSNGDVFETASVVIALTDSYEDKVFNGHVNLNSQAEVDAFAANNYTHINGGLIIGIFTGPEYSDITDLSGLNTLEYVGYNCYITFNADLTNLNGFDNIIYFGGDFGIIDNPALVNIEGLGNVRT